MQICRLSKLLLNHVIWFLRASFTEISTKRKKLPQQHNLDVIDTEHGPVPGGCSYQSGPRGGRFVSPAHGPNRAVNVNPTRTTCADSVLFIPHSREHTLLSYHILGEFIKHLEISNIYIYTKGLFESEWLLSEQLVDFFCWYSNFGFYCSLP